MRLASLRLTSPTCCLLHMHGWLCHLLRPVQAGTCIAKHPPRDCTYRALLQANKAALACTLDRIGSFWSKAVVTSALATLMALPLMGIPVLGPGGALYRAMGVLMAGSPCAVVLVPLAHVCAIATLARKVGERKMAQHDGIAAAACLLRLC